MEKRIRSNKIGPQGCYFIRRLANNLGEPQRSYAINAIDRALKFWKAKPVRRPAPLRAPWLLSPTWKKDPEALLTSQVYATRHYSVSLQPPSTGIIFTKFPSVLDSLCNYKEHATRWAADETPTCTCSTMRGYVNVSTPTDGDNLHFEDKPLESIATGSLQNKIFFHLNEKLQRHSMQR